MTTCMEPASDERTRIAIVEDEGLIAMDLRQRLEILGYGTCGIAVSGPEAIALAARERPDLVLMDIVLEGEMDGTEAARQIRDQLNLPVVYITSYADDDTLRRAGQTLPLGYVVKPFTDNDLNTSIRLGLYRHGMEMKLRKQREWLDATLRSMADAVVATDDAGLIRLMNPMAERITGWSEAEAQGRPFRDVVSLFDPWSHKPVEPVTDALRNNKFLSSARFTLCSRNFTEIEVEDSLSRIAGAGDAGGSVFVFRDISERLRSERAARHYQRLESVARLAAGFAKDVGGQISGIRQAISAGMHEPDVSAAAERAERLIDQILTLGRRHSPDLSPVDVNQLVLSMSELMRSALGSGVELVFRLQAPRPWVMADGPQLDRVILNIFLNARDAVGAAGTIRVTTANTLMSTADGEIDALAIRITDTGQGISPELKSRIFEPFFTTKENAGGTGLSLASAYGVISQAGGQIDVECGSSLGCTFIILLPCAKEPEACAEKPEV